MINPRRIPADPLRNKAPTLERQFEKKTCDFASRHLDGAAFAWLFGMNSTSDERGICAADSSGKVVTKD